MRVSLADVGRTVVQILATSGWLALGDGLSKVVGFAATATLARVLGPTAYGHYAFALAIISYLTLFAYFGLSVHGARHLAQTSRKADVAVNVTVIRVLSILALLMGAITAFYLAPFENIDRVLLTSGALVLIPLAMNPEWIAQGLQSFAAIGATRLLIRCVLLGLVITVVHQAQDVRAAAILRPAAELVGQLPLWWFVLSRLRMRPRMVDIKAWPFHITQSAPLLLSVMVSSVYAGTSDQVFLRAYHSPATVAYYAAAYSIYQGISGGAAVLSFAYLPKLAAATGSGHRRILLEFLAASIGFGLASLAVVLVSAPQLLAVTFGHEYVVGSTPLRILGAGLPILSVATVATTQLTVLGRGHALTAAYAAGMVANLSLNFALVPRLSTVGAALSTDAAEVVVLLSAAVMAFGLAPKAAVRS